MDGLRGFCALLVLSGHLFYPGQMLDPRWAPPAVLGGLDMGTPAVLMFFVLSGYVIGLTTSGPLDLTALKRYGARRALRLVPLVFLAVMLSWVLLPHVGGRTIIGNLLFLQNDYPYPGIGSLPILPNNPSLWSLHYEVVYYASFVAIWWLAPRVFVLLVGLLFLGVASSCGLPMPHLVTRYACGGLYWMSGLCLAWFTRPPEEHHLSRTNWPSALLAVYATWVFCPMRTWLVRHGVSDGSAVSSLLPHRLDFLPVCFWFILAVSGRGAPLRKWLTFVCLGWAMGGALYTMLIGGWEEVHWMGAFALAIAAVLARREVTCEPFEKLAPLGGISFGLYVFALPIQLGQRALLPSLCGNALTFGLRLVFVLLVAFGLSWLAERRFQPWLTARLGFRSSRRK